MPLSIASRTRCQPATGAAAESPASSAIRTQAALLVASRTERAAKGPCGAYAATRLVSEERGEEAAGAEQLGRRALLDDPALVEHDREVGDADRREPLGRDEHGSPGDRRAEVLDEQALRLGVDGGHRIVEHEDARAGEERPRERDALALAAGEVDAAFADQRVVAVGQVVDEGRDSGGVAGGEHVVPVGVGPRGEQVVAQEHREEHGLLRDDRDGATELRDRRVARVDSADEDTPGRRVVETGKQVEQRRLAGAGRAAERDDLAGLDGEVDAAQHLCAAVGEVDVLEAHRRAPGRELTAGPPAPAAARSPRAMRSSARPTRRRAGRG